MSALGIAKGLGGLLIATVLVGNAVYANTRPDPEAANAARNAARCEAANDRYQQAVKAGRTPDSVAGLLFTGNSACDMSAASENLATVKVERLCVRWDKAQTTRWNRVKTQGQFDRADSGDGSSCDESPRLARAYDRALDRSDGNDHRVSTDSSTDGGGSVSVSSCIGHHLVRLCARS